MTATNMTASLAKAKMHCAAAMESAVRTIQPGRDMRF